MAQSTARRYRARLQRQPERRAAVDLFFVDATASRGQQSLSAFGPHAGNDLYSNRNRTDIDTWSISPYLTHRFGNFASGVLRYTRDSVERRRRVRLQQHRRRHHPCHAHQRRTLPDRRLGPDLRASRARRRRVRRLDERKPGPPTCATVLTRRAGRCWPMPATTATTTKALGGGDQGANWSLGFAWTPSLRTNDSRRSAATSTAPPAPCRRCTVQPPHDLEYQLRRYRDARAQQFLLPSTLDTACAARQHVRRRLPRSGRAPARVAAYIQANGLPPSLADSVNYLSNRFLPPEISCARRRVQQSAQHAWSSALCQRAASRCPPARATARCWASGMAI